MTEVGGMYEHPSPANAWRLVLQALLWEVGALVTGAAGTLISAMGLFVAAQATGQEFNFLLTRLEYVGSIVGILGRSGVLLFAARGEFRISQGTPGVLLPRPVTRLVGLGAGILTAFVVAYPIAMAWMLLQMDSALARAIHDDDSPIRPDYLILFVPVFVFVGAVATELFYRGWLWRGLREVWGLPAGLLITSLMSSLPSVTIGGATALAQAIPGTLAFGLAREIGGGTRLPIVLHAIYSSFFMAAPWLLKYAGAI
jgi:membrane protease YdiL (CAAX protease family)